jgi:hypothetical protein
MKAVIKRLLRLIIILLKILLSSRIRLLELNHQLIRRPSIVLQLSHTITQEVSPVLLPQQLPRLIVQLSIVHQQNLIITRGLFLALLPLPLLLQTHIRRLNTVPQLKVSIIQDHLLALHLPHHQLQPQLQGLQQSPLPLHIQQRNTALLLRPSTFQGHSFAQQL